jgi:branched-chain amino acid transport system permease protein
MSGEILLQTLVSGLLIGLIYALVAVGLTLIFGVMDIVNFSHGEFLMFGMYSGFWLYALFRLDPVYTLPLTAIFLFGVGVLVYRFVISKIIDASMLSQIFTTFGLMILFRGIAQFFWKPDFRTVDNSVVAGTISVLGIQVGWWRASAPFWSLPASCFFSRAPAQAQPSRRLRQTRRRHV